MEWLLEDVEKAKGVNGLRMDWTMNLSFAIRNLCFILYLFVLMGFFKGRRTLMGT